MRRLVECVKHQETENRRLMKTIDSRKDGYYGKGQKQTRPGKENTQKAETEERTDAAQEVAGRHLVVIRYLSIQQTSIFFRSAIGEQIVPCCRRLVARCCDVYVNNCDQLFIRPGLS